MKWYFYIGLILLLTLSGCGGEKENALEQQDKPSSEFYIGEVFMTNAGTLNGRLYPPLENPEDSQYSVVPAEAEYEDIIEMTRGIVPGETKALHKTFGYLQLLETGELLVVTQNVSTDLNNARAESRYTFAPETAQYKALLEITPDLDTDPEFLFIEHVNILDD